MYQQEMFNFYEPELLVELRQANRNVKVFDEEGAVIATIRNSSIEEIAFGSYEGGIGDFNEGPGSTGFAFVDTSYNFMDPNTPFFVMEAYGSGEFDS